MVRSMSWPGADLGVKTELNITADGIANLNILLVNNILSINKLGNVEANIVNFVLALDLGDLDGLGDTDLLGGWVGEGARDLKRRCYQWNLVSLGLVFLMASLGISKAISMMSIALIWSSLRK